MHFNTVALPLLAGFSHVVHASPTLRATSIDWSVCGTNVTSSLLCGTLEVPRDYTKSESEEKITLYLVKLPAAKQPSKGSVILNTGGPGFAQRSDLLGAGGKAFSLLAGGDYDVVTFDPRGTGETLPFSCYNSTAERTAASTGVPTTWDESDAALGYVWGAKEIMGARCLLQAPENGELIGTAFVARDIIRIVDALGEDGMVRYYGLSYGTALGATLAAMFPDRIDKMVLDGVLNMDQYYEGRELQQVTDSDATWAGFFKGCMEASESLCPLKRRCDSAEALQTKIEDLITTIKYAPIPLGPIMPAELVDYSTLKNLIFTGLYYPTNWPILAALFDAILSANLKSYINNALAISGALASSPGFPSYNGPEALQGIRCGETAFRADNVTDLIPTLHEFKEKSWIIGDSESTSIYMSCAAWQMKAKEIYSGGFENLKTKNPILFVGSPHDPLTPLPSARNVSAAFEGSAVLQHEGYGHCSISQPSLCVGKAIAAYFRDGTLPDANAMCKPSVPIFRPAAESLLSVLSPLNETSKRSLEERDEDAQLLEAMGHVGRTMSRRGRLF